MKARDRPADLVTREGRLESATKVQPTVSVRRASDSGNRCNLLKINRLKVVPEAGFEPATKGL